MVLVSGPVVEGVVGSWRRWWWGSLVVIVVEPEVCLVFAVNLD